MKKAAIMTSIVVLLLIFISFGLFNLSKSRSFQLFGGLVTKIDITEKIVALTFDDGPGINTDEILEILNKKEVKGTFYLTGREIEEHMEEAKKIVQAGHEIGNHSYSHQRMVLKPLSFIKEEIERTDELIRDIGYDKEIHFRPPFGKRLFLLPYYLAKHDRKTILWSIEPETYENIASDSTKITDYVVENIDPGSIVLLHVMYENRHESLAAVEKIITSLKEEGYTFATVSELLELELKTN